MGGRVPSASPPETHSRTNQIPSGNEQSGRTADFNVPHYPFFSALIFAHRARCAAAILFLPAADIVRLGRAVLFCAAFCPLVGVPSNNRTTWLNLAISSFTS